MKKRKQRCPMCASVVDIDSSSVTAYCSHCNNQFLVSASKRLAVLNDARADEFKNLRLQQADAVSANKYSLLSSVSRQILDIVEDDYLSTYYYAYAVGMTGDRSYIVDFLKNGTILYTSQDAQTVREHMVNNGTPCAVCNEENYVKELEVSDIIDKTDSKGHVVCRITFPEEDWYSAIPGQYTYWPNPNIRFGLFSRVANVRIMEGIKIIPSKTFSFNKRLENIDMPNNVIEIGDKAFRMCTNLVKFNMPNSVRFIGDLVFYGCTNLVKIKLSANLITVGAFAFWSCDKLKKITFGSAVKSIGECAFYECLNLTEIKVDKDNQYFCSVGGVLYSKDMSVLLCVPAGKKCSKFTVPSTVTSIASWAFAGNTTITKVIVPSSVKEIGYYAFGRCTKLATIDIEGETDKIKFHKSWCKNSPIDKQYKD